MHFWSTAVFDIIQLIIATIWTNIQTALGENKNVVCNIDTYPVAFGNFGRIACHSLEEDACVKDKTRTWMKGTKSEIMLFNNGAPSSLNMRYKEKIVSCNKVILEISNFSEEDLNNVFTCSIGFAHCRVKSPLQLAYLPTEEEIYKEVTKSDNLTKINITLSKVYPSPNCSVLKESSGVLNISEKPQPFGIFFTYNLQIWISRRECPLSFNVSCKLGSENITIYRWISNSSITDNNDKSRYSCTPMTVSMIVIVLFCIAELGQSICRNIKKLLKCLTELRNRSIKEMRRPIFGAGCVVVTLIFVSILIYLSSRSSHLENCNDSLNITVMVIAFILSNASITFISNPDTISVRKGFRTSINRFQKKLIHAYGWMQKECGLKDEESNSTEREETVPMTEM